MSKEPDVTQKGATRKVREDSLIITETPLTITEAGAAAVAPRKIRMFNFTSYAYFA